MTAINVHSASVLTGAPLGGEGWLQIGELGLALLLSACVGLEREIRQKNAGLRTHTYPGGAGRGAVHAGEQVRVQRRDRDAADRA